MKAMKTFAALLALAFSLAGCGAVDGDPVRPAPGSAGQGSSTAASGADSAEPEQLAALRQLAGENGDLAGVLYLGSVPERTTDVHAVLDSLPEQPWQFVADIPADRWVTAPGGGRELYCIFAVRREDTLFVYEKQDPAYPAQLGKELYGRQGGQPILLLCNGSREDHRHHGNGLLQHRTPAGLEPAAFRRDRPPCAGGGRRRFFPTPNARRCPLRCAPAGHEKGELMKKLKLLAALLALTIGLAGCGGSSKGGSPASSASKNKLDGDNMTASSTQEQEYEEPEDVTYMRLLAGEDEYRACVLYLGGSYEVTTDVQKVLDSQTDLRDLWGFVYDIPQDHWVVAPDGGCDLYCIFPQDPDATLFVYETSLTDDAENPLQRGKQLYYSEDGQPILLLCNISDIAPNTEVELYPSTSEELVFSPFLSGENGHVVEAEGVCDFTIYPEGDDWETDTSPWSLEGNWLETGRDTDEGYFDTDPADADRMCFLPTDADTEGSQLPLTASYITPYPELNVEEADLFYQEGTPEVPFQTNQEWYATFTGEDGSRYAVTLEDENTLALKFYLEGEESYMSLVSTVYFARQEAMG